MIHCILEAEADNPVCVYRQHLNSPLLAGDATTTNEVINQLLHHVGAMCIHQLNLLAASNNLPISNFLGKQHPIEAHHLSSICDIMEKAMVNGDTCIIRCILVVFQVQNLKWASKLTWKNEELGLEYREPQLSFLFNFIFFLHWNPCNGG